MKLFFWKKFGKNTQKTKFVIVLPVTDELLRADRRTDRYDEVNSRFSQFCESA